MRGSGGLKRTSVQQRSVSGDGGGLTVGDLRWLVASAEELGLKDEEMIEVSSGRGGPSITLSSVVEA